MTKSVVNILKSRECLRLYIKAKHSLYTSNHLSRHCKLKRCTTVHIDAEMLYRKDAVFWLTNFKRVHFPPPHPLGAFFIKSLFWGCVVSLLSSETSHRSPTLISRLTNDRCPLVLNATPLPSEPLPAVRKYGDVKSPHQ